MKSNLNKQNELIANLYVAKVLRVVAGFAVLTIILNYLGVFSVRQSIMIPACVGSMIWVLLPTFILSVLKKNEWWMKYVAVIGSCVFILLISSALNFHVTLLFLFPIAMASVYFDPKLNWIALILGIVCSTGGKVIAFYLQTVPDQNYNGIQSLLIKNCFPQTMMLGSIGLIFVSLAKNTSRMLNSLMNAEEQEKMFLHMKKLTDKSTDVSKGLSLEMETLTDVTKSTLHANNEISENTEVIIEGITNSMLQLEDAEGNSTQIYENIQVLTDESEEIAQLFTNVEALSDQNKVYMQDVTTGMEDATQSTSICQAAMLQLEEKTRKIDGIVDVIADISDQTDLLSLNAAIESARAGEQGKGFAIVAEEIRKLSQQTQKTLDDVREIIGEVLEQNVIAVEAMNQTSTVHERQKEVILKAESSAQEVTDATKNMAKKMNLILSNTKNIEKSAGKIVRIVNEITAICKENQTSLEAVSESVNSGISASSKLEELVQSISQMSEQLAVVIED